MSKTLRHAITTTLAFAAIAPASICLHAQSASLQVSVGEDGRYSISTAGSNTPALQSGVAAEIDQRWVHASDYPTHTIHRSQSQGYLGAAEEYEVTYSGLKGIPDLTYRLRTYSSEPFADVLVTVHNTTGKTVNVQAIRSVDVSGGDIAALGGAASADRVLSDSFSEDRPAMKLHDLGDPINNMHRGVGVQLIYNRESHESLFIGALSSDKFLTILRLHVDAAGSNPHISSYEVEATGTTEMEKENSLEHSPADDQIELSLPVAPGADLASECVAISVGKDYLHQFDTYGSLIRTLHHARVSAPPLLGWWSWTAYYFGLNEGAALTNAQWLSEHLKQYGYNVFHIDEGYQYARGEYVTPDASLFPQGLTPMEYKIRGLGLVPGIWTAPFEVSERSSVYQQHPDWLVKNAQGKPIPAGHVTDHKDQLYMLDTTNPGAQQYLRETYAKLVRQWDLHYIKMDFMDDSAIEGYRYKPHTTAMEAQRIGLQIIRDTVGDDVYLDKDGSVMMTPVGIVDYGRISQDTGHSFGASKDAATGVAARYYMNRNYFVADPDAFTVSTQRITDHSWHEGGHPLTMDEAKASIALSAVSGGMLEIGDNLTSLQNAPDRVALIENRDLIDMVRLGQASRPVDLMTYSESDGQPSIFYLKESDRQSILTVFNWTEQPTHHSIALADLGLSASGNYTITSSLDQNAPVPASSGTVQFDLPAHSVQMLKIVDQSHPVGTLDLTAEAPDSGKAGETLSFSAHAQTGNPALSYTWDFGDGVKLDGAQVTHTWTEPGDYEIHLTAAGLEDSHGEKTLHVHVTGNMPTSFTPQRNQRFEQK